MTIRDDLYLLAHEGGRKPGSAGHAAARALIEQRLADLGLRPFGGGGYEHVSWHRGVDIRNIVGVIPGLDPTAAPLLIGAHYDSFIPAPSADDNAAAVAAMLSVAASLIRGDALQRDVLVVAFDTEEPPYFLTPAMGSERLVADTLVGTSIGLAVILDLIGHPMSLPGYPLDPHMIFAVGSETHSALPPQLQRLDMPVVATRWDRVGDFSDYAAFRRAGIPWLFFSCGEWPDYHQASDTPDKVDVAKVERLAAALVDLLRGVDAAGLGPAQDNDTTDFEIATMRRWLGDPMLAAGAAALGLPGITRREHLDVLVPALRDLAGRA